VIHNGGSIDRAAIPRLLFAGFREAVTRSRVCALFAVERELYAVLSDDDEGVLEVVSTVIDGDTFPSMTETCPQVHLFEREIYEEWGWLPVGHPWLKPVRFPRARRPGSTNAAMPPIGITDFYRIEGDEIHEVAVGPVHAGVIEPGHFRFQCHGEHVFHLEISLGYQYRGVERELLARPKRAIHVIETVAGDTTCGHAIAYAQAIEALSGTKISARAMSIRAIGLELERLANHTGDLGALAGDVGYLPTANYCGRLRGDFLNATALLCGSRFGRGLVRPGGVGFDLDQTRAGEMKRRLESALEDVENAVNLLWEAPTVLARFEATGAVSAEIAKDLGLVGVAARASGLERDVRHDLPAGIYRFEQVPVSTWQTGDVFARAYVRWLEIQRSIAFLELKLDTKNEGPLREAIKPLAPNRVAVSLVEGWRGEVCHVAITGADGALASYKIVDPSFHNWTGLAMALRDQQISDFPLCNKSFNLSYCGHDL
jgi:Ni,Fe-hydrogenase III large subunit